MIKQYMIYLMLPLLAASCTTASKQDTAENLPAATETVAQADSTPVAQTDAVTGATNVANAPSFNGVIVIPPQNHISLTLSMGGSVHDIRVLPGQHIRKGEVILTLANPEFIELQQSYLDAAAQAEYLEKEFNRQQNLSLNESASLKRMQQSKADYLSMKSRKEATAAKLSLLGVDTSTLATEGIQPLLAIKAPQSGYVTNMDINAGKYYQAGERVCDVIDKSTPLLQLTAYEKDLHKLSPNCQFAFSVNGIADSTFTARLVSIDQMVDNTNRSIKVYAKIMQSNPNFRPGMYVTAKITDKKP